MINDLFLCLIYNALFWQYFDRADQEKSLDHARFELMSEVHKHLQIFSPKALLRNGQLSKESLKRFFIYIFLLVISWDLLYEEI